MNLQLELYKFKREFGAKFPSEKVAIMQEATQALSRDFQNRRTLSPHSAGKSRDKVVLLT